MSNQYYPYRSYAKRSNVCYVAKITRRASIKMIRAFIPNPYELAIIIAVFLAIKFLG